MLTVFFVILSVIPFASAAPVQCSDASACGPMPACFAPPICDKLATVQGPQCLLNADGSCSFDHLCGSCLCPDGTTVVSGQSCSSTDPPPVDCSAVSCLAVVLECEGGVAPIVKPGECCPSCPKKCESTQCGPAPLCAAFIFECPAGSSKMGSGCYETSQGTCAWHNPCGFACKCADNGKVVSSPGQTCSSDTCLDQCGPQPMCAAPFGGENGLIGCPIGSTPVGATCADEDGDGVCSWQNACGGCECPDGLVVSPFGGSCAVNCALVDCLGITKCPNGLPPVTPPGSCCPQCVEQTCSENECPVVDCLPTMQTCAQRGGTPAPSGCFPDASGRCNLHNPCGQECICPDGRRISGATETCATPVDTCADSCGPMPLCLMYHPCPEGSDPVSPKCVASTQSAFGASSGSSDEPAILPAPECSWKFPCGGCRCRSSGLEFSSSSSPAEGASMCSDQPKTPCELNLCPRPMCLADSTSSAGSDAPALWQPVCPEGTKRAPAQCVNNSDGKSCHWESPCGGDCQCENGATWTEGQGCGDTSPCAAVLCASPDALDCGPGVKPIKRATDCCHSCPRKCDTEKCGPQPLCAFWQNCEGDDKVLVSPACMETTDGSCAWRNACSSCVCKSTGEAVSFGQSCPGEKPDCSAVSCLAVECAADEVKVTAPDACCPQCVSQAAHCQCAPIPEGGCGQGKKWTLADPAQGCTFGCGSCQDSVDPVCECARPPDSCPEGQSLQTATTGTCKCQSCMPIDKSAELCEGVFCTLSVPGCGPGVQPFTPWSECCQRCPTVDEQKCVVNGVDKARSCASQTMTCFAGESLVRGDDCCFRCEDDEANDNAGASLVASVVVAWAAVMALAL